MACLAYDYAIDFLVDRTTRSMIGYCHHNVVSLSVTLCIMAKRKSSLNNSIGSAQCSPRNTTVQRPVTNIDPELSNRSLQNFHIWNSRRQHEIAYLE